MISMLRSYLMLVVLCYSLVTHGQSIKDFLKTCNEVPINSRFDVKSTRYVYEYDKYSYGRTYLLACDKFKTLYNVPINKVLMQVVENDTVNALKIYLPFDSSFHKRMEADLGPSEQTWMMFPPGHVDTAGIIWDKQWFINDYVVWVRCTKYIALLGETREDLIVVTLAKKVKR